MSKNIYGRLALSVGVGGTCLLLSACAGTDSTGSSVGGSTGINVGGAATGGASAGGTTGAGGSPLGGNPSLGGTVSTGGAAGLGGAATGGAQPVGGNPATGGSPATGGASTGGAVATGGSIAVAGTVGTGGSNVTGGTVGTGGAKSGGTSSTGGSKPTGGTSSTGGSKPTGGTSSTGGTATGGSTGSNAACPGADPAEFALISAWLNNTSAVGALPSYAYSNIKTYFPATNSATPQFTFNRLACSIAMSCVEFAPMESGWLRKCEALLTSAIVAESSYNPNSSVPSPTNDPTVGLLQIRFSSTVKDYNYNGPKAKIAAVGCNWPPELLTLASSSGNWTTLGQLGSPAGASPYVYNSPSFMQDPACNIPLAAWYYFYNATGNGGASNANVVWISGYCSGGGIAGNMLYGLDSHLDGGSSIPRTNSTATPPVLLDWSFLTGSNLSYPLGIECCASGSTCTGCTGRFAAFMGIGTTAAHPSPDPFLETLVPEPSKYCGP